MLNVGLAFLFHSKIRAFILPLSFLFCTNLTAQTTPTPDQDSGRQKIPKLMNYFGQKEVQPNTLVGNLPLKEKLDLFVVFDAKDVDDFYDANGYPGRIITSEEWGGNEGLRQVFYRKPVDFFKSHGFVIKQLLNNMVCIEMNGTVADIQKTFYIHLLNYKRLDGSFFHVPDREPSIDLDIPIYKIDGLDNRVWAGPG